MKIRSLCWNLVVNADCLDQCADHVTMGPVHQKFNSGRYSQMAVATEAWRLGVQSSSVVATMNRQTETKGFNTIDLSASQCLGICKLNPHSIQLASILFLVLVIHHGSLIILFPNGFYLSTNVVRKRKHFVVVLFLTCSVLLIICTILSNMLNFVLLTKIPIFNKDPLNNIFKERIRYF